MISYLRNKANGDEKYPIATPKVNCKEGRHTNQDLYRMVEYYGMTDCIYPIRLTAMCTSMDSVKMFGSKKVNTSKLVPFHLNQDGRCVRSYEVTMGTVQQLIIGWDWSNDLAMNPDDPVDFADCQDIVGIDLIESTYMSRFNRILIDGLEHSKGTVVRAEDCGNAWYVNGKEVIFGAHLSEQLLSNKIPLIIVRGEIEITSVDFDDSYRVGEDESK